MIQMQVLQTQQSLFIDPQKIHKFLYYCQPTNKQNSTNITKNIITYNTPNSITKQKTPHSLIRYTYIFYQIKYEHLISTNFLPAEKNLIKSIYNSLISSKT
eukprot:EC097141.1.p2 GENE.EC097141.1~~EC097141.1.p2  ORF type:complete len:101 (-),score=8.91 EC097141.1:293-595(-)